MLGAWIQDEHVRETLRVYLEERMADAIYQKGDAVGVERIRLDAELDVLLLMWKDLCVLKL